MARRNRCDDILRLIDEALASIEPPTPAPVPNASSRSLHPGAERPTVQLTR